MSDIHMTHADAERELGTRDSRKVGNNTYLKKRDDTTIALMLHATDVVTWSPGTVTLSSGGCRTMTTKDRINRAVKVYSHKSTWYIGDWREHGGVVFYDGIVLSEAGELISEPMADPTAEHAKLKKRISAYAKLCADTLAAGMETPSGGDCWYCCMRTDDGGTLGDTFTDDSHLLSHMDEGYVVPSLLLNAVAEKGYPYPTLIVGWKEGGETMGGRYCHSDIVRRAVAAYMKRRLLPSETGGRPAANHSNRFAVR